MFNARLGPSPLGFPYSCNSVVKILLLGREGIGLAGSWVDAVPDFGVRPRFSINYIGECLGFLSIRSKLKCLFG